MQHTKQAHCFKVSGNGVPTMKALSFTVRITTFPNEQSVLVGLIAYTGVICKYNLRKIIVEYTADILGTLLNV